ncbi:two-component system CheB/CheR fusion protein [Pedobacter cryoconitis]|uniref:histidine kinase n=1 Tax=Pedobacter cryoconitis TaxID=188932 RepID=A0A7W9DHV8_9SPHI|nr:chemotaxis protein CheB [Pedobacter cryoconitis]MBB5619523.1 two-component system CheB/CheR fusion protein [Pedobacter cryoconitis]
MKTDMRDQQEHSYSKEDAQYIVAIGASAGGLEAIHEFFDNMPQSSDFAFVVIQHLSSDHKSLLVELVSKHTQMQVIEAAHNMLIQQGFVYIIPNNKLMTVSKGRLKLADKSKIKAPNMAVDVFLHTLAKDKKERAIAIILSGTGTDGTKGVQSIKENGGMVLIQDPVTAKFDGMPNSAISLGEADYILSPAKMFQELLNHVNEDPLEVLDHNNVDEGMLDTIFKMVHEQSGNNFNLYKTPTIIRRIGRRMNENGLHTVESYIRFLKDNINEVKILGQDFLIGVTKFFRDKDHFEFLEKTILPDIISNKKDREILKVWVCACSTGQEAYTIAILINECLERAGKTLEVKVFATDIDQKSIEIASKNKYPENIRKEVPAALFKKYFIQEGDFYSVSPVIRKQLVFVKHDVIKSPPFIKNDLVSCRNMLIYMNKTLQEKVLSTLHFSLNKGGYLFLGSSETAHVLKGGISESAEKWKIYQKSGAINYSSFNTYNTSGRLLTSEDKTGKNIPEPAQTPIEKRFNKFIIDELGYAGVFIDKGYVIKEVIGNYKNFLSLPDQKIELNILKMVPKEIAVVLNTALRKVWKENTAVHLNKLRINRNENPSLLNIAIQPPDEAGYTMLTFTAHAADAVPDKDDSNSSPLSSVQYDEYVFELEAELNESRSNLQLAMEEMETTNEELQSTNEELLSANEELQSGNEELQSLNEELYTLNTEHQVKIKELVELNDDLDNYFRSTDIGQVFLDSNLYIRKFNAAAIHIINMIEADIGRSFVQISTNLIAENLITDVSSVLSGGPVIEKEVTLKNGKRSLMRIMPYIRKDKKRDGAVITFVDITHITELNNIISGVFNASLNGILAFTAVRNKEGIIVDFKCTSFNDSALKLLQKDKIELESALLVKQLPELIQGSLFTKYINLVEKGKNIETEFQDAAGSWYKIVAVKMSDGFVATLSDITDQKAAEDRLKKNYNELIIARESLKSLNTELEIKVAERTRELSESEERFNQVSRATNDTIWDWSLVQNTMWRSDNFNSMFGYESTGESSNIGFWFEKIHPEDRKGVQDSVYEAINTNKKQWSAQYRVRKDDGSYAVILDRGSIMHDDFDTPYRMVGSMVDVTKLIETEAKLTSSEEKFEKVFHSNMIGMMFSNIDTGLIADANDVFLRMIGYCKEDLTGGLDWTKITPPEYNQVTEEAMSRLRTEGVCPPYEKEYICKDGSRIFVMIGSALLGKDAETVTYIIDITEQKIAEQKRAELQLQVKNQQEEFYRIFKNAPALITIRRGKDLVYEFTNNKFNEFVGAEDFIGQASAVAHPKYVGSPIAEIEQQVLRTGETYIAKSFNIKYKHPGYGVAEHWFDFTFIPVYTANGLVDGIAFFGFDVTDLLKAQQTTKELMHKKDEFMSIASHELKTPITSIKGFLQLALRFAEKTQQNNQMLTLIGKAEKQIGNLTSLVNDLLDVTKIQAGKMQFNYKHFNIKSTLEECIDDIRHTEDYEIIIDHIDDIQVYGDQHRIEQVVNNFLSNAIKYSPKRRTARVYTELIGDDLKLTVKDFGIGIPQDKIENVFDRFFRVDAVSAMFSGLGLGLYICAEIISRHGGQIGVDSVENEGSEFWFQIPVKGAEKKDE